jgi:hypothetical protein
LITLSLRAAEAAEKAEEAEREAELVALELLFLAEQCYN